MAVDTITTQDLLQLQQALAFVDLNGENAASAPEDLRFLLFRLNHIKVQMYLERGPHKQPHFHIEFKREYRASYAIDTLERIIVTCRSGMKRPCSSGHVRAKLS